MTQHPSTRRGPSTGRRGSHQLDFVINLIMTINQLHTGQQWPSTSCILDNNQLATRLTEDTQPSTGYLPNNSRPATRLALPGSPNERLNLVLHMYLGIRRHFKFCAFKVFEGQVDIGLSAQNHLRSKRYVDLTEVLSIDSFLRVEIGVFAPANQFLVLRQIWLIVLKSWREAVLCKEDRRTEESMARVGNQVLYSMWGSRQLFESMHPRCLRARWTLVCPPKTVSKRLES